jgi:hypothetical protein
MSNLLEFQVLIVVIMVVFAVIGTVGYYRDLKNKK